MTDVRKWSLTYLEISFDYTENTFTIRIQELVISSFECITTFNKRNFLTYIE